MPPFHLASSAKLRANECAAWKKPRREQQFFVFQFGAAGTKPEAVNYVFGGRAASKPLLTRVALDVQLILY